MPMFDDTAFLVFGVKPELLVLAAASVGLVIGLALLRRTLTIEPDSRSFRATDRRTPSLETLLIALIVALPVAFLLWAAIPLARDVLR
jgi:hypothetical protein